MGRLPSCFGGGFHCVPRDLDDASSSDDTTPEARKDQQYPSPAKQHLQHKLPQKTSLEFDKFEEKRESGKVEDEKTTCFVSYRISALHKQPASSYTSQPTELPPQVQELQIAVTSDTGRLELGSTLSMSASGPLDGWAMQWSRVLPSGIVQVLDGADSPVYALEANDVGHLIRCDLTPPSGETYAIRFREPVQISSELQALLAELSMQPRGHTFEAELLWKNGQAIPNPQTYELQILASGVRLVSGGKVVLQEPYHSGMLAVGSRHGSTQAARILYFTISDRRSVMLGFRSPLERNAALVYVRAMARHFADLEIAEPLRPHFNQFMLHSPARIKRQSLEAAANGWLQVAI
eukprot:jgi/Chlat1/205/Chrsp1S03124